MRGQPSTVCEKEAGNVVAKLRALGEGRNLVMSSPNEHRSRWTCDAEGEARPGSATAGGTQTHLLCLQV